NKGRTSVGGAAGDPAGDHSELRVYRRAASADCRLRMASGAAIFVKTWTESTVGDRINFVEGGQAVIEKCQAACRVVRSHGSQRPSSAGGAASDSWVALGKRRSDHEQRCHC